MVFITAEIGINHNGDLDIAKKLIDIASNAGCDAVKFQKRTIDNVYSKNLLDSPRDSPGGNTQRAQKEGLEFSEKQFKIIDSYCKRAKILWFVSCWDVDSQLQMRKFNLKFNKVSKLPEDTTNNTAAKVKKRPNNCSNVILFLSQILAMIIINAGIVP